MKKKIELLSCTTAIYFLAFCLLSAQENPKFSLWLGAGQFKFDLAGTGDAFLTTLRGDYSISKHVLAEIGVGYVSTEQQAFIFLVDVPYFIHEVQIQGQLDLRAFRPYVGLGFGGLLNVQSEDALFQYDAWKASYTGAIGFRLFPVSSFGIRGEFRLRGMDWAFPDAVFHFSSSSLELTGSLGVRF
ncbi:MAG: outer membrane beta-barrel protein [Ignavibacteriae bacterium]|nr:outer membrane beta-barrel protein [Ignavibacteriota bacterium]MCB9214392.1 outer membrane beta-barrel protein [Ignavibacteria bacterium]